MSLMLFLSVEMALDSVYLMLPFALPREASKFLMRDAVLASVVWAMIRSVGGSWWRSLAVKKDVERCV